ncbi:unnamed protein product [Dovyalis caffra]|uniref:Uncharacterized protein n=1 Tax=Dovyalis caffra TaxID=77055 RepID=A0AAV1RE05_9ROSI|nr:unnamed protein product [Dovyalis caffra]
MKKDVVYLGSWDVILSCKIQSKELDFVGILLHEDVRQTGRVVFPISAPWWPTPVLTCPQNAETGD